MTLDNNSTAKVLAPNEIATIKEAFDVENTSAKDVITVTNNLESISPTGIVTRYAPYGLILVAGVVLLVISKKRKKNTDEE